MLSPTSPINLARLGELPASFAQPIAHSREGLVISGLAIASLAIFFDLSVIAAIGAISMLVIHLTVHVGHLRLLRETGAAPRLVALAIAANAGAIALGGYYLFHTNAMLLAWIAAFFALALLTEVALRRISGRVVQTRIDGG